MQETQFIDWDALSASGSRTINKQIASRYPGAKVFCHEPYALNFYETMIGLGVTRKDFKDGDIFKLTRVVSADGTEITFELENGLHVKIDLSKERNYCAIYDLEPNEFAMWLKTDNVQYFESEPKIMLTGSNKSMHGDLYKAHIVKTQEEFIQQINDSSLAYTGKVIAKNKGGFMINVLGVDGFLPGGLAAANKIIDFDSLIGKDVTVMVEDYLQDTKTFVFSNKKYLAKVLPTKMRELSTEDKIIGNVTGASKFGIFVEFDGIFTGLLHTSKMSEQTKQRFDSRNYRPGDEISFWIKEITNDNRIILTEEDPSVRIAEFEDFKSKNIGVVHSGKVIKNIPFGTLVKIEKDLVGLISKQELKSKKRNFLPGDDVIVTVDSVKKDKIYLSLIDENQELQ